MVDIRNDICGILVGGAPAPGINGVISAVVIQCGQWDIMPIGIMRGFKFLKQGLTQHYMELKAEDVSRVHNRGGSILATSREQIETEEDMENVIRALQHLKIRYLITIGGTATAFSAHKLACALRDRYLSKQMKNLEWVPTNDIFVTHVPKTIFNDLPLPHNCFTFGFSTARELGTKIVSNLSQDAKAMHRWYIVTVIGAQSGHLAIGIGKAAAATITIIPEQFETRMKKQKENGTINIDQKLQEVKLNSKLSNENSNLKSTNQNGNNHNQNNNDNINENKESENSTKEQNIQTNSNESSSETPQYVTMKEIVDILDASIIKRCAGGKDYGVAVIGEGLVDLMDPKDIKTYFDGMIDRGHELLAHEVKTMLLQRWKDRSHEMFFRTKFVGFELRSADPNAQDIILSRDLGYAAVYTCRVKKVNATMVAIKGHDLITIPLSEMVDPDTQQPFVHSVDINSLVYTVATSYMIRLTKADLRNEKILQSLANVACMDCDTFRKNYSYIAQ